MHTSGRYGHAGVMRILVSAQCNVSEQNKVIIFGPRKKRVGNCFCSPRWLRAIFHFLFSSLGSMTTGRGSTSTERRHGAAHRRRHGQTEINSHPTRRRLFDSRQEQGNTRVSLSSTTGVDSADVHIATHTNENNRIKAITCLISKENWPLISPDAKSFTK